ncbi:hypothetical protein BH695_0650 [Microcystis aeruginosa PCC 7806SL]|uniref:Uncharacterized protein n=1 Tax=Microcystis aeruginosa PCC 7806SL TaxID=1903187 RepID=A0AB33BM32_MICA7|nr:hypothetical protein BH695_0650 [Microcystis aeruginosa PCC 7806SL]
MQVITVQSIIAKNQSILLMILDKFLNLKGTSIQGYLHLENMALRYLLWFDRGA